MSPVLVLSVLLLLKQGLEHVVLFRPEDNIDRVLSIAASIIDRLYLHLLGSLGFGGTLGLVGTMTSVALGTSMAAMAARLARTVSLLKASVALLRRTK